jgi:hypothetical protein
MPHPYRGSCHDRSTALKWFLQINQQTCYSQKISSNTNVFPNEYWRWRLISRPAVYRQFANGAIIAAVHTARVLGPVFCVLHSFVSHKCLSQLEQWLVKSKLRFRCLSDTSQTMCSVCSLSACSVRTRLIPVYLFTKGGRMENKKGWKENRQILVLATLSHNVHAYTLILSDGLLKVWKGPPFTPALFGRDRGKHRKI